MRIKKSNDVLAVMLSAAILLGYLAGWVGFILLVAWLIKSCIFS